MTTTLPDIRSVLWDVFRNYPREKQQPFAKNHWREGFQKSVIEVFGRLEFCLPFKAHGSAGQGNWAEIPWIGFRDDSITDSFQDGVYVVYLYPSNLSGVYLSLNQGVTAVREASGFRAADGILRKRAEQLRTTLTIPRSLADDTIALRARGENGLLYEAGHICGLYYPASARITTKLGHNLEAMLNLYRQVIGILRPAVAEDAVSIHKSSLERETDEFLERAALDTTTDVQSGTETSPTLVRRRKRQQALRRALLRAYEAECAACGLSFSIGDAHMLHAAHVIDVEDHGASVVKNGLLLCPHHHWAFDAGCWLITDDYRVEVHPAYKNHAFLAEIDGRLIVSPRNEIFRVDSKAIAIRRQKWASGFGSKVAAKEDDIVLLELP